MNKAKLEYILNDTLKKLGLDYKKHNNPDYYTVYLNDERNPVYFVVDVPKNYSELGRYLMNIVNMSGKYKEFGEYICNKYDI